MLDFYRDKRILVTGHTGFKGAWLSKILVKAGAKIVGYALKPPTEPSLFEILNLKKEMVSIEGDVRDLRHLKEVFDKYQPELVIHMAAQPIVRVSYEDPVYTYETNVMGTVNLLECVRQTDSVKSVLNVTTDKVYENRELTRGYVEEDFLDGYDPYSNSKSCSELVTHSYIKSFFQDRDIAVSTARAGNVIGGGDFAPDRVIPDCARAALEGREMSIRNPKSIRPYQHVLEPLYVYLTILERQYEDHSLAGYYNVGPDDADCVNTGHLVELFQKYWGEGFFYQNRPDGGPHEAGFLKLNCDKLKRVFGWQPTRGIEDAIEWTVDWFRAYGAGEDMEQITSEQIARWYEK